MVDEIATKNATAYQLIWGTDATRMSIQKALPPGVTINKFQKSIFLACNKNPDILKCSKESMLLAFIEAATKGLDPTISNTCFFIPRKNNKKGIWELSMQVGYRTIINWIMNSEQIADINVFIAYDGENFEIKGGVNSGIVHDIDPGVKKSWETIRYVYGVAKTVKGGKIWRYLDKDGIKARRAKAQTEMIWNAWPIEMVLKTGLIYLSKYLPMNSEVMRDIDKQEGQLTGIEVPDPGKVSLPDVKIVHAEDKADDVLRPTE